MRLYEAEGKDTSAEVNLFGKTVSVTVSHNGLKTLGEDGNELDAME